MRGFGTSVPVPKWRDNPGDPRGDIDPKPLLERPLKRSNAQRPVVQRTRSSVGQLELPRFVGYGFLIFQAACEAA